MRTRITYANVAATLALVFSMSGGALAAKHYLISSTKQISPKVLKKLKGATGKTGPAGAAGKEGARGNDGAAGKEGAEGKRGPSEAFSVFHDEAVVLAGSASAQDVLSLPALPAGSFVVTATFDLLNGAASAVDMKCFLNAGGDFDTKRVLLQANGGNNVDNLPVAMQVTHTFATAGNTVTLTCEDFGVSSVQAELIKITALQVGALTNKAA